MASFATVSNHRVLWMAFIDHCEFEAMKMLSGRRASHCDKHQFCAKMMVSTQTIFEISLLNIVVLTRKKIRKMALSWPHTFAFSCLPRSFWPLIWVLLITKTLKEEAWALLACLWWSYMAFAYVLHILHVSWRHPYIESLSDMDDTRVHTQSLQYSRCY